MNNESTESDFESRKTAMNMALEWLSRTIAILLFMVGPGLLGSWIDKKAGTSFFTPAGLILGMFLATGLLILLAGKLVPPTRGKPIPYDDDDEVDGDDSETT